MGDKVKENEFLLQSSDHLSQGWATIFVCGPHYASGSGISPMGSGVGGIGRPDLCAPLMFIGDL